MSGLSDGQHRPRLRVAKLSGSGFLASGVRRSDQRNLSVMWHHSRQTPCSEIGGRRPSSSNVQTHVHWTRSPSMQFDLERARCSVTLFTAKPWLLPRSRGESVLSVVCRLPNDAVKGWAVAKVTIENDKFVHESRGSYFTFEGAMKMHCSLLNIPCEYGESIDDFM